MEIEAHTFMDGRLHVYRRDNSRYWQCSTYLNRRNHRTTTKETNLKLAKDFAINWYMERCTEESRRRRGLPLYDTLDESAQPADLIDRRKKSKPTGPTFREVTEGYVKEAAVILAEERNPRYMTQIELHLRVHLLPFFGDMAVSEITAGAIQDYRAHRSTPRTDENGRVWKRASRSTLHKEIVTLRQVLKYANRKGSLPVLPNMSAPYKKSGKITHRAWFSPDEYQRLYEASRERAANPKKERWRTAGENLHDYILFMVNTGLRPDEALSTQMISGVR